MEKVSVWAVELLEVVAVALGLGAFSTLGLYLERLGLAALTAGQLTLGVWSLWMGGIALYAGLYLFGYVELVPRLRGLSRALTEIRGESPRL